MKAAASSQTTSPAPAAGKLRRTLGPFALTFNGLGIILGAGIFSVIGVAAGRAGDALWIAFCASGAVAFFTALTYAELATSYPKASAEFTYLSKAFPRAPSFAVVIGVLVAFSGIATTATVALAFGGYLAGFVDVPPFVAAVSLIAVATAIVIIGTRQASSVTIVFTLVEMAGLIAVVVIGAETPRFGEALSTPVHWGLASATALVFFSFLGFENIANLAEEAKNPGRDVPIAIFASLAVATVLYALVALAVVALIPSEQLAASDAPLVTAVATQSSWGARALGGIALFATANTGLASILVASRVLFGMARERALPAVLDRVLAKRKTPWVATLVTSAIAMAMLPLGKVEIVASISSFAALLAFVAVNVALIALRRRDPDRERPFRVPLAIRGVPVLPIIGVLASVALLTRLDYRALLIGGALALLTLAVDVVVRRRKRAGTV